jgi:creatinine amidohydrolase
VTVHLLAELRFEELARLPKTPLLAILPVGATEAHGPHLPLGTDVIIAEAMARAGAERLSARGATVLVAPALGYTSAGYAAGFPGTISIRPETVTALVCDVIRSLVRHDVKTIAIANAHLEPAHIASLHAAVTETASEARVVYPDVTRKPWALRLGDEFKSGACHAGQYEGSIVLAERPELVDEGVARTLPPNPVSLSRAIREGKTTFEAAGGIRAYFGAPALATAEEGRRTIQELGAILEEAVVEAGVFS